MHSFNLIGIGRTAKDATIPMNKNDVIKSFHPTATESSQFGTRPLNIVGHRHARHPTQVRLADRVNRLSTIILPYQSTTPCSVTGEEGIGQQGHQQGQVINITRQHQQSVSWHQLATTAWLDLRSVNKNELAKYAIQGHQLAPIDRLATRRSTGQRPID